jgi:3-hydroxyisobutyrate dehydrogenase
MRYGFIGLGNLGGHLAASLLKAGFEVTSTISIRAWQAASRHGRAWAATPAELAATATRSSPACRRRPCREKVLKEVLTTAKSGATWIEMSTLGRDEILRLGAIAAEKGVRTMELPVTGGVHLAAQGQITMLAGGDKDLFDLHLPALEAMGNQIFHMGPLGNSSIIKVITNMLAFIHLKACGEALMLAKRGGLDLGQAWAAIKASSGNSFVHETEGALILNGSYDIAFNIDLALKDLGFAMEFGREFGVPLELASMTEQTYVEAKAAYGGNAQSPMIAKLLEDRLGTDLRAPGLPAPGKLE